MQRRNIWMTAVAMVLGSTVNLWAQEVNVDDLAREFMGERASVQRGGEELTTAYGKVVESLMSDLASEDVGRRNNAESRIERMAFRASRPGAEEERLACGKAIAGALKPEVPPVAGVWLLRQVERMGRAEVVGAVGGLLNTKDATLRDAARRALLKNPSAEAGAALRSALESADTAEWRVALINALAVRCDAADLSVLLKEAAAENDDVRTAAVRGLAKIGDKSAATAIAAAMGKGSPAARVVANDSYLILADAVVAKGDATTALGMYRKLLPEQGQWRCAAIIGLGRAGGAAELPTILEAMADPDIRLRGSCVEALVLLKGQGITTVLAERYKGAPTEAKPALLEAIGRRGEKSGLATLTAAVGESDEAIRLAALKGLSLMGDGSTVPLLLKVAAGDGKAAEAARTALERLTAEDVNPVLRSSIGSQEAKIRLEVVRALSGRRVVAATPALLKSAEDADGGVRGESLRALGRVAPMDAMAAIAALLVKTNDDAVRNESANALASIAGRQQDVEKAGAPVLTALASAQGPARATLLGVLGRIGGEKALEAVRTATKDSDEKIKDAAIRAMAGWPDAAAAPDLLALAKDSADETHRVLSFRGYVRVVRMESDRPAVQTAKMLAAAMTVSNRADDLRQVLGGLADVRDVAALEAVLPVLDNSELREEAGISAMRIGWEIVDGKPEQVKAAMEKVLGVCKNEGTQRRAKETLERADRRLNEINKKK